MKHRKSRQQHDHYHFHYPKCGIGPKPAGFFKRTIRGVADHFRIPKGLVICGFIFLFFMSLPLAILTFLGAAYWVRHPGKLEDHFDSFMEKSGRSFASMSATASASPAGHPQGEDGFDFQDLKEQFDDLEKRAGKMETHVSSDEYTLNKEFNDIKNG